MSLCREQIIASIQKEIEEIIAASPELSRQLDLLCSIPCVGVVTAQTVLAELPPDIGSARAAAAYAGLTPQREDSGQKSGRARVSKTGNTHLRQAFYMPAVIARSRNERVKALNERLESRGLCAGQAIAAGMHLLLRLCYGVLARGQRYDPCWQENRRKMRAPLLA